MIDWNAVDTVFLDMDGTVLDLHFDIPFWREHLPLRYAAARGLPLERARAELKARYHSHEGTLACYCAEHWSRELGLDIALLKQEVDHLIAVHPSGDRTFWKPWLPWASDGYWSPTPTRSRSRSRLRRPAWPVISSTSSAPTS